MKKYKKKKDWVKFHAVIHEGAQEALNIIIMKDNVGNCREFVPLLYPFADSLAYQNDLEGRQIGHGVYPAKIRKIRRMNEGKILITEIDGE
jgi:hypothetical protein